MSNNLGHRAPLTGRYMVFRIGRDEYAVPVHCVHEFVGLPMGVLEQGGVLLFRGRVVPVVDLKARFGLGETAHTSETIVVIVRVQRAGQEASVGILVDEMHEVRELAVADVHAPPPIAGGTLMRAAIVGVARPDERTIYILDLDKCVHF